MPVFDVPIRRKPTLSELEAGDELSERYRIIRQLGVGGMGAVYEAEQIQLRKRVALKIMHPERAERATSTKRFLREARAASAIKHRNVVEILDFGELEDGTTYLVMEKLQGTDLSSLLKREGPLSWPRTRGILLKVLRGLKAAHDAKIIHRDIKPANIYVLDPDDEYAKADDRVKVLDFGIAHVEMSEDETQQLTDTSELLGTVTYMAPELARKGQASAQSDLYAVGIMAYKMLTGMTPFGGGTGLQILYAHIHDEPPSPRSLEPSIPEAVEAVILRALAKRPQDRFEDADELARTLACIDDDGRITASELSDVLRRPTAPPLSSSSSRSLTSPDGMDAESGSRMRSVLGVVVALVVVSMLGAVVWMWSGSGSGSGSKDVAEQGVEVSEHRALLAPVDVEPRDVESGSSGMAGGVGDTGDTGDTGETDVAGSSSGGVEPEAVASETKSARGTKRGRKKRPPKKTVAESAPVVLPITLSDADMRSVRTKAEQASRVCGKSERAMAKSIDMEFAVGPKGKVVRVGVQGRHKGTLVGSCVADAMKKRRFPESQHGVKSKTWTLPLR